MPKRPDRPPPPQELAFRDLARAYRRSVKRLAERCGVLRADSEDVAQIVLHVLWHQIRRHGVPQHVEGWLATVTRRVATRNHPAALGWRLLGPADAGAETVGPSSEELYQAMETAKLTAEVLASVDPVRAEVLRLHDLEGKSAVAIANAQRVPVGTVYTRIRLARIDFSAAYLRLCKRNPGKRRAVLLPLLSFRGEVALRPAGTARGPGLVRRAAALLWSLAIIALCAIDTRLHPATADQRGPLAGALVSQERALPPPGASDPPAGVWSRDVPLPAAAPSPSLAGASAPSPSPSLAGASAPSPSLAGASAPSPSLAGASAPASSGAGGGPAIVVSLPAAGPRQRPSRRAGELEAARLLLDTAHRMAAEGQARAAAGAAEDYRAQAPSDPLPANRAALDAEHPPAASRPASR